MNQVAKNIQECPHLQISTDDKPSCMNCGLVQERQSASYIRCISHYKKVYLQAQSSGEANLEAKYPIAVYLLPAPLQIQIHKFHIRTNRLRLNKLSETNRQDGGNDEKRNQLYDDYIRFLNENATHTLPKKERKRPISAIYGEHKKIILDWIMLYLKAKPEDMLCMD